MRIAKACAAKLPLLLSLVCSFDALAVEPKTGDGGVAIKKAQGLIRQLSQEKTVLETEKIAWLNEKNVLEGKLKSLDDSVRKLQPLQVEVERYKAGLESLKSSFDAQLGEERQRHQALLQKHNDMVAKANAIHADNHLLVQAIQEREQWIEQCSTSNKDLRSANVEILDKYKDKDLLQHLVELEPFTGIGRIETETTVEDFKYKLQQLKITPFKAAGLKAQPAAVKQAIEGEAKQ